ncbi:hypothetical protein SCLCIDRAFT_29768 [Scleroderma citrinum Foug A]|uniref:Uncharacterized protein n=1 Tax=Scleroderma citrinum Foug A TaxID=1036808 RepID=A0A0C3DIS5_9AGAM|nr:hypothetical protein SCLCIDRAFT_29768 [Scleroderma citrinum Foug A]
MDEQVDFHIPPAIFLMLWNLPNGAYGISYDIDTRKTEDVPPHGWGLYRAATYRGLAKQLQRRGYEQCQYSDWLNADTTAADTYMTMLSLMRIEPPGKLQSTLKGVKIHYLADPGGLDGTNTIELGGAYSMHLRGPTRAREYPSCCTSGIAAAPSVHQRI